jgi:predicted ATPase/DNA-binding CsgD family transcriptional regulator
MKARALRGRQASFPSVRDNLPRYLTSFVGRRTELSGLKSLLARSRMVTLTGPGGAGKSRLAAELCRASLNRWPHGIWWVELAPVSDPRQVASTAVAVLELPGYGPAEDRLMAWLADARALLVLDNCEHLVAACAAFCRTVLQGCPGVTILATSREALRVAGEARWPLSSLAASEAITLFEARARLALPDFNVDAPNREAVALICEHLDRLPLAVELAAARIDVMAEQEILSQLSDRFRLLAGGSRSDPKRLRTMEAAIDWSYRLLAEDEAKLFRRLSVFRGGFTPESAHAVCSDGVTEKVLDLLTGLVHKSMVVAERTDRTGSRYRLLESQVAYGEDRLREVGELEVISQRHYAYFRESFSTRTPYNRARPKAAPPTGFTEAQWIARESGNLMAAIEWVRNCPDDSALSLAADLAGTWSGDFTPIRRLLEELLARPSVKGPARLQGLYFASCLASNQGDYEAATGMAEGCLALAREMGDVEMMSRALYAASLALQGRGELAPAAARCEEAIFLLQNSNNHGLVGMARNAIAEVAFQRGDSGTARRILVDCVRAARARGDVRRMANHLDALAWAQRCCNEPEAAAATWKESVSTFALLNDQLGIVSGLDGLSCVAEGRGDDKRARRLAAAATRMSNEMSFRYVPWYLGQIEASRHRSQSRLGPRKTEDAWTQGWSMSLDQAIEYALGEGELETVIDASPLSRRESEVAKLVAAGMSNRRIGERLYISERTVEGHVERIRNKLGARSRTGVATWAFKNGLMADLSAKTESHQETEAHDRLLSSRAGLSSRE